MITSDNPKSIFHSSVKWNHDAQTFGEALGRNSEEDFIEEDKTILVKTDFLMKKLSSLPPILLPQLISTVGLNVEETFPKLMQWLCLESFSECVLNFDLVQELERAMIKRGEELRAKREEETQDPKHLHLVRE